jgi:phosphatidylserine decarboxylase
MPLTPHQYIDRRSGEVRTEQLYADPVVMAFYGPVREHMPTVLNWLTSRTSTQMLGLLNYDLPWSGGRGRRFLREQGVDLAECVDDPATFSTARQVFERKIRYWECRPMPAEPFTVVSPADARVLAGSFAAHSALHIKGKFFERAELFGERDSWVERFRHGDWLIFRLTPEKYHYNHAPVSGRVLDVYTVDGVYHSCNPGAAMIVATPYSKNRRVVTIIDTDVPGGTQVGVVAMIEIVALMIGEIVQCYSTHEYEQPCDVVPGMFVERGNPKSLFRPGSSTTVLVFEPGRVRFAPDLLANGQCDGASSRYLLDSGCRPIETDVAVRSPVGYARACVTPRCDSEKQHVE